MSIRVLLADDHAMVRMGIKALLERDATIDVVGEASDGREATRQIVDAGLACKVLVLTVHAQEEYLLPLLKAGAHGYVVKTSTPTDLLEAIRIVHRGQIFL